MIYRYLILLVSTFYCINVSAQYQGRVGTISHFCLITEKDSVEFLIADSILIEKKSPLILFQGSLPVPLLVHIPDYGPYLLGGGISNFDLATLRQDFHIVVISMPHTPFIAQQSNLNSQYCYIPNPTKPEDFHPKYVESDFLENYVRRGRLVLEFLLEQDWIDSEKVVLAGHSQGAKIATKIALGERSVTHLGLFGANPMGRLDEQIRRTKLQAHRQEIAWEEAEQIIESHYNFARTVYDTTSILTHPQHKSWKTFSQPFIDDWLLLDIPMYLAYGTEDITADLCDLVPLYFIQAGKSNLTHRRYLHLEHNFFEVDESGKTKYDSPHWTEVMQEFLEWVDE